MKQLYYLSFLLCLIFIISCKKTIDPVDEEVKPLTLVKAESENVAAFEFVQLNGKGISSGSYSGTFGGKSIILNKTSDSTLNFVVPDLPTGEHLLKFELGHVAFKVTGAKEINVEKISSELEKKLAEYLVIVKSDTTFLTEDRESMKSEFKALFEKFAALSAAEKRETLLFIEANKKMFDNIRENADQLKGEPGNLRVNTTTCTDETNSLVFFTCHAQSLATMASHLSSSFIKIQKIYKYETRYVIATLLAFYSEWEAVYTFRIHLDLFLRKQWVVDNTFQNVPIEFVNKETRNLQLGAHLRPINPVTDNQLFPKFFEEIRYLKSEWLKYDRTIGRFPSFTHNTTPIKLETKNVEISQLSPRVAVWQQSGELIQFHSINGTKEYFDYIITIKKDGFEIKNKHYGTLTVSNEYKLEYVSGDKQHYRGGMPYPMVFKVREVSTGDYIPWVAGISGFSIKAKSTVGYLEGDEFYRSNNICDTCFGGYYYVENTSGKDFTIVVKVELYKGNELIDSYNLTQYIVGN